MEKIVAITLPLSDEHNDDAVRRAILAALARDGAGAADGDISYSLIKRSLDARHGRQKLFLRFRVVIGASDGEGTAGGGGAAGAEHTLSGGGAGESAAQPAPFTWRRAEGNRQVVIIGAGPAGLFAALRLLEDGIRPVIIERGEGAAKRRRDIARISREHALNPESNYCFGLGGAGTFSDGKLYTRSNKRGSVEHVLRVLSHFGADMSILSDAHAHIGSDKLPAIVENIRAFIESMGGEVLLGTKCGDIIIEENGDARRAAGVRVRGETSEREISGDAVMLCAGQNAEDMYALLARCAPRALEAKGFAVGVRCEHPRRVIDAIQYHTPHPPEGLTPAEYRLAAQIGGRGVWSFCMCPGGFIVPASSAPGRIVVNGMSASGRNSAWSNAAIVVETRIEDIPDEFVRASRDAGCEALAGLLWRGALERAAFEVAGARDARAPAQRLTDFLAHRASRTLPATSYAPGVVPARLDGLLPRGIAERLTAAFGVFDRKMRGFIRDDAVLVALESRTSSPVSILRDRDTFECVALARLYPAGEGAGYAGGIVSSAMDGRNTASRICARLS